MEVRTFVIFLIFSLINAFQCFETSANCSCVPFHQCVDGENDVNTDGSGLLDVRKLDKNACGGHFDVCCWNISRQEPITEKPIELTGCGYQNSGFFPWSAGLLYQKRNKTPYINKCGVSLINKKAAITAAHCIDANGHWHVRIGNVLRSIAKIIIHPQYNDATLHNDIALLILASPVPISKKIATICVPPPGISTNQGACNTPTWITHQTNNKTYSYLKMMRLPLIERDECLKRLRNTRLGPLFQLHHGFLCAGGSGGEDTCAGNGGNPLVCPVPGQPGRFHQVGVVSWGIGCGESLVPGVYVKLDVFRAWIDGNMAENGLDTSSYRY